MMSFSRCVVGMMVLIAVTMAGCGHEDGGGGSKWFGKQAKGTGAKPIVPVKAAKSAKVKGSRGLSPLQPMKLQPSRGPSPLKPMKVQPTRMPTPLKPLSLQPTRRQPSTLKDLFNPPPKNQKATLGQPPQQPRNFWEWLAGNPEINQTPGQKKDSGFRSWFKASKGQ